METVKETREEEDEVEEVNTVEGKALQLDEEVCFVAHISPDELCNDDMALMWSGAQLQADANCEQDSVAFRLTNTGSGGMDEPQAYRVHIVNDDIVIFLEGDLGAVIGPLRQEYQADQLAALSDS